MEIWSAAYEDPIPSGDVVETWDQPESGKGYDGRASLTSNGKSLTPNLDRLMGVRASHADAAPASRGQSTAPRGYGHDAFFENPPMTTMSKSGDDKKKRKRRGHDHHDDAKECKHEGDCSCRSAEPVPEPGTLLLAGAASAAAWGARRRARRRALQSQPISD
jgi:hypothetical protein